MGAVIRNNTKCFSRTFRLLGADDFSRVFARSNRSRDAYYTVLYRAGKQPTARIGFAIAKKRISSAPARNRVRRLARESFRQIRASLPPLDIIILAQSAAADATNSELFTSLDKHWQTILATANKSQRYKDKKN